MSKTIKQSISVQQKKGLVKMYSILVNMVQDHRIDDLYVIGGKDYTLAQISSKIKLYIDRTTYTHIEKEFLNEVRNLVLQYQGGELHNTHTTWERYHPYDMSFLTTMSNNTA